MADDDDGIINGQGHDRDSPVAVGTEPPPLPQEASLLPRQLVYGISDDLQHQQYDAKTDPRLATIHYLSEASNGASSSMGKANEIIMLNPRLEQTSNSGISLPRIAQSRNSAKINATTSGQRYERSALILYGTETGNSEDVADSLATMVERLHFKTRLREMDTVELKDLFKFTLVVFVISTTGQGEFPQNSKKFWKSLLRKRLPPGCLQQVTFTTFGLGDSSYPKFNWTARKLHKRLEQLGANEVYFRGEADEQHEDGIDGTFVPWRDDFRKHLLIKYPLPEGEDPISVDVLLPSKVFLRIKGEKVGSVDGNRRAGIESVAKEGSPTLMNIGSDLDSARTQTLSNDFTSSVENNQSANATSLEVVSKTQMSRSSRSVASNEGDYETFVEANIDEDTARDASLNTSLYVTTTAPPTINGIGDPEKFEAFVQSNKRLTPPDHGQDVREITLFVNIPSEFAAGAVAIIYPTNDDNDVQNLIDLMDWHNIADEDVVIEENQVDMITGFGTNIPPDLSNFNAPMRLCTPRNLLKLKLDITAIPKVKFFEYIYHFCSDEMQRERIKEFIESREEYLDYAYRPRRTIIEVLADFDKVKIPWQAIPTVFQLIRPRQYSIASGGPLKQCSVPGYNATIQLVVAVLKYQTVIRKYRQGLCSGFLAALPTNSTMWISLSWGSGFSGNSSRIPQGPSVMIATGTGIAPIRSIIWEHSTMTSAVALLDGDDSHYLFFGCRNENADFFYKDEWNLPWLKTHVFPAFSRDQREKIYVQDVIRQQKSLLFELIRNQNATIYICGSSGAMPKAVKQALIDVLTADEASAESREEAVQYLEKMEMHMRYLQETW